MLDIDKFNRSTEGQAQIKKTEKLRKAIQRRKGEMA